jgi:hypothetical protein
MTLGVINRHPKESFIATLVHLQYDIYPRTPSGVSENQHAKVQKLN